MLKHMKILIVDDIAENIQLLGTILRREKYKISFATSGMQALDVAKKTLPDLILLDVKMPEMDGFETCRRIKADPAFQELPVIFITGRTDSASEIRGFEVGGVDYITRPFHDETVLERVKVHLHIRYLQQQLREETDRYRALECAAFDGIAIHENGQLKEVSDTLAAMFAYEAGQLIGRNILELIAQQDRDSLSSGREPHDGVRRIITGIRQDGSSFPIEFREKNTRYRGREVRVSAVRDMSSERRLEQENLALRAGMDNREHLAGLVGKSPAMHRIFDRIISAAVSDEITVIYGETGTGKELAARTIYGLSPRSGRRFLPVNCSAVQESIFETLFFGYRKGTFTGADHDRPGYFEQADGGTLFLDEIGELTAAMQAKLLRVLQDGEFTPLGSEKPRRADVRIIAATNRELRDLVKSGQMREDFFQRIHVIALEMPPLRNRREDIGLLIDSFLKKRAGDKTEKREIPDQVMERFLRYDWPGNVRELFNELRRWMAVGEVELGGSPLSRDSEVSALTEQGQTFQELVENYEKKLLTEALIRHKSNRTHVTEAIGIPRKTLQRKISRYGITL